MKDVSLSLLRLLRQRARRVRQQHQSRSIERARRAADVDNKLITSYFSSQSVCKLHIGCGENLIPGWLNCDLMTDSHQVLRLDATRRFPFPDNSFDYVFSEHMIEHIQFPECIAMLHECFRVLSPNGRLRISTPDLAFLVGLYRREKTPSELAYLEFHTNHLFRWAPYVDEAFVINNFVRDWGHQFIFDAQILGRAMGDAGFVEISGHQLQESDHLALRNLENTCRYPDGMLQMETFTLEASKPKVIPLP